MKEKGVAIVFYLDLDRTLFRTDHADEIFAAIERCYPDNSTIGGGYDKRADYYVFPHEGDDVTYYHDIVGQLREAGLDYQEVFTRVRGALSDGRFEYPGARELVKKLHSLGEVKVLTYGEDYYQRFKASLCPSLDGIEVVTITTPKVEYLNSYASGGDWIIDDKRLDGLRSDVHAVYLQHTLEGSADAHSLAEAEAIIIKELSS